MAPIVFNYQFCSQKRGTCGTCGGIFQVSLYLYFLFFKNNKNNKVTPATPASPSNIKDLAHSVSHYEIYSIKIYKKNFRKSVFMGKWTSLGSVGPPARRSTAGPKLVHRNIKKPPMHHFGAQIHRLGACAPKWCTAVAPLWLVSAH